MVMMYMIISVLDERIHLVAVGMTFIPAFEVKVLEEDEENIVYRRDDSKTVKTKKRWQFNATLY